MGVFVLERGSQNLFQRCHWLSRRKPAFYFTPNQQAEKQKICESVVCCLPTASSLQSRSKSAPSRKLDIFPLVAVGVLTGARGSDGKRAQNYRILPSHE